MSTAEIEYRGLSPSQFFWRNREIAGFSNPARALYQTVRELVENSLDATETYGILPDIKVRIRVDEEDPSRVSVRVEDNGIGVPLEEVPHVFGRVFYGSKYVLRQSRGVFGLGVKMAVLYAQITTGRPVYVKSSTPDSPVIYEFELMIDVETNTPLILNQRLYKKRRNWHGTAVELTIEGNWSLARRKVLEYFKRTALIAPYANIQLETPEERLEFKRATREMPAPPKLGKPHPRGVDVELLRMLIGAADSRIALREFLMEFFDAVGPRTAESFCEWAGFDPSTKVGKLKLEDLERLAKKMKEFGRWRRPRSLTLSPLGEELLKKGVRKILKPDYVTAVTRSPSSYGGNPFVVEVALAYGGEIPPGNSAMLFRFANRIPLLYDEGADVAREVVDKIDWSVYKVKFPAPLAIVVHICSTKLPFKGVGKEAIADVPEVEKEIEIAVRTAARRLRTHLTKLKKMYELKRREATIGRYIGEVARALGYVTGVGEREVEERLKIMLMRDVEKRARSR